MFRGDCISAISGCVKNSLQPCIFDGFGRTLLPFALSFCWLSTSVSKRTSGFFNHMKFMVVKPIYSYISFLGTQNIKSCLDMTTKVRKLLLLHTWVVFKTLEIIVKTASCNWFVVFSTASANDARSENLAFFVFQA